MQQIILSIPTRKKYSKKIIRKAHSTTIGSKYQMVIPKEIRREMNIKPGDKLYIDTIDNHTIYLIVPQKNWSDQNYGALKKYWKGINMIEEVEKIRNESES